MSALSGWLRNWAFKVPLFNRAWILFEIDMENFSDLGLGVVRDRDDIVSTGPHVVEGNTNRGTLE